ncbi:alpha/beta fold hydrolase [Geodermatophilus sp. URMC 62]|uniref:alpha/beta fold hydrolase n=1 Tax=Geodermatophilus sp. URMC 62 TaxID=3423414 RepID=UPI00406C8D1B
MSAPERIVRDGFWIAGELRGTPTGTASVGSMYVERLSPDTTTRPHPVVLVHGGGGQATDYLGTPDGRPGWAQQLVGEGFTVYVVDRPGHGRSPHDPAVFGPTITALTAERFLSIFAPEAYATTHTQWPVGRTLDDPGVQQVTASFGPMLADWAVMHAVEQQRLAALLDRIGPAIVFCHSAGGPAGYLAADARPELVEALVAIETVGPPFASHPTGNVLSWGLACAPLTYDPPAADAAELRLVSEEVPGGPPRTLQAEPARRLAHLAQVPIAVVTSPNSPFRSFDDHLLAFLRQAGCQADAVRLEDHGVLGNGHGMMFELNNGEALQVILDWLGKRVQ